MRRAVPADRVGYRANSLFGLLEAAKAGMGLAPLPCFLGDADPGLRRFTPPIADFAVDLWILTHEDLKQSGRVRAFMEFMADALGREAPLLEGRLPGVDEAAVPRRPLAATAV
jgi:DNA-binding transcriptional LysR family regulator